MRKVTENVPVKTVAFVDGIETLCFNVPVTRLNVLNYLVRTGAVEEILAFLCALVGRSWDYPRAKIVAVRRTPLNETEVTLSFAQPWYESKETLQAYVRYGTIPDQS